MLSTEKRKREEDNTKVKKHTGLTLLNVKPKIHSESISLIARLPVDPDKTTFLGLSNYYVKFIEIEWTNIKKKTHKKIFFMKKDNFIQNSHTTNAPGEMGYFRQRMCAVYTFVTNMLLQHACGRIPPNICKFLVTQYNGDLGKFIPGFPFEEDKKKDCKEEKHQVLFDFDFYRMFVSVIQYSDIFNRNLKRTFFKLVHPLFMEGFGQTRIHLFNMFEAANLQDNEMYWNHKDCKFLKYKSSPDYWYTDDPNIYSYDNIPNSMKIDKSIIYKISFELDEMIDDIVDKYKGKIESEKIIKEPKNKKRKNNKLAVTVPINPIETIQYHFPSNGHINNIIEEEIENFEEEMEKEVDNREEEIENRKLEIEKEIENRKLEMEKEIENRKEEMEKEIENTKLEFHEIVNEQLKHHTLRLNKVIQTMNSTRNSFNELESKVDNIHDQVDELQTLYSTYVVPVKQILQPLLDKLNIHIN